MSAKRKLKRTQRKEMGDKEYIRCLEQKVKSLQQEIDTGFSTVWKTAIDYMETRFAPLMVEIIELEHLMGYIEGICTHKEMPEQINADLNKQLGDTIGDVYRLDRYFSEPVHADNIFDLSPAHALHDAMVSYSAVADQGGARARKAYERLKVATIQRNPMKQRFADTLEALRKKKSKGRQPQVIMIGSAVAQVLNENPDMTVEQAADTALSRLGLNYERGTAISYYYRIRERKALTHETN